MKLLIVLVVLSLAGCQTRSGNFCDIAQPLRLSAATVGALPDDDVAQALKHNERGRALCGWKP